MSASTGQKQLKMSVPVQKPVVPVCFVYQDALMKGATFVVTGDIPDLTKVGFNDKASSIIVSKGDWALYEDIDYKGKMMILGPGTYDNLRTLGNDTLSSIKLQLKGTHAAKGAQQKI